MILKKPYAFLIKYYRVIHLALALFLGAIAVKMSNILKFFNAYIKNNYTSTVVSNLDSIYTPLSLFAIILVVIFLVTAILILLMHKKKPTKLYVLMLIYYVFIFGGLFYIKAILQNFEIELLSSTTSRSIRDIILISYFPQFLFVIFVLLRTIGFNIKKFDFNDERKNLDSGFEDSEEFEINLKFDGYKIRQGLNRFIREFIYYIKENRFIVLCIVVIVSAFGGYFLYNNVKPSYDLNYRLGTTFKYNGLSVTIKDSMITNVDYRGNQIDNNYYLVLKVNFENDSGHVVNIDYNSFKLILGNTSITPSLNLSSKFVDFASSSVPSAVSHNVNKTFALVYKISDNSIKKSMKISIYNGSVYRKGEYLNRHINITLNPTVVKNNEIVGNYRLNEEVKFDKSSLGNSSLTIHSYAIVKNYYYKYLSCDKYNSCLEYFDGITVSTKDNRQNNKLLVMNLKYFIDSNLEYMPPFESIGRLSDNFINIEYKINDQVYTDNAINVTPSNAEGFAAFEVPADIDNADIIQAIIRIRNKSYIVNLKM